MSTSTGPTVHHINFLVRDLSAAADRFTRTLDLAFDSVEALPERGVVLRRARAGETWIVLVQPVADDGIPARMLADRGEGVMLISFGVDGLEAALRRAESAGARALGTPRDGLDAWRVADLDPASMFGVSIQLVEDPSRTGSTDSVDFNH